MSPHCIMSIFNKAFTDILGALKRRMAEHSAVPVMDKESRISYKNNRPDTMRPKVEMERTDLIKNYRMVWQWDIQTTGKWYMTSIGMQICHIAAANILGPLKGRFPVSEFVQARVFSDDAYTPLLFLSKGQEPSTYKGWLDVAMEQWLTHLQNNKFPFQHDKFSRCVYKLSLYTSVYKRTPDHSVTCRSMFEAEIENLPEETLQYDTTNIGWAGHELLVMLEWRNNKLSFVIIDEVQPKEYFWPVHDLIRTAVQHAAIRCRFPMPIKNGPTYHNQLFKIGETGSCVPMNIQAMVQLAIFEDPSFIANEFDELILHYILVQMLRTRTFFLTSPLKDEGVFVYQVNTLIQNNEQTFLNEPSDGTIRWLSKDGTKTVILHFNPNIDAPIAFTPDIPRDECPVLVDDIYFNEGLVGGPFSHNA